MVATGRLATAMSQGANEEEDEKRLFSVLLQGDLILLIDNVRRPIQGDALCTITHAIVLAKPDTRREVAKSSCKQTR